MAKRDKRVKTQATPDVQKQPRTAERSEVRGTFLWSFALFDDWEHCRRDLRDGKQQVFDFHVILQQLRSVELKSWNEIYRDRSRDHAVDLGALSKEAQARLGQIVLDDAPELWSIHITGQQRIWGIKQGTLFRVLWWDPYHRVYPSLKN